MTTFSTGRSQSRHRLWLVNSLILLLVAGSALDPINRALSDDLKPQTFQIIDLSVAPSKQVFGASDDDHLSGNGGSGFPRARALATGDVNDDGFRDLIIGAPDTDFTPEGGALRSNAGAVYVVFGAANLPDTVDTNLAALPADQPAIKVFGAAQDDALGFAVASGDVNGDGIDDIVMGAPGVDFGDPARTGAGAVFVLFGAADLAPATVDLAVDDSANLEIGGAAEGDLFGSAIALGDVNGGASRPDLFVGAPGSKGPDPGGAARTDGGAAYVLFGGTALENPDPTTKVLDLATTGTAQVIIFGIAASRLGSSVAIGDYNGATAADLLVGAPTADNPTAMPGTEAGAVFGILGGTNLDPVAPATSKTFDINATDQNLSIYGDLSGDHLGASVATGDVEGNAASDILIGAPDSAGANDLRPQSGSVYLITGGAALTPAPATTEVQIDVGIDEIALSVFGAQDGDHLGSSVSIGVVNTLMNTDSIPDVLMGAPGAESGKGVVYGLFGGASLVTIPTRDMSIGQDDFRIVGELAGDELGWAIATGDFDHNTGGDIAVGAPFADVTIDATTRTGAGKVYVVLASGSVVPNANPIVVVTAPNGGETLAGGSTFHITWTATDPNGDGTIQSFEIRLSTDGGANFNTIVAPSVIGSARTFDWDVPSGLNTTTARIRVTAFDNAGGSGQDASNNDFSISDVGVVVTLSTPNGGETLQWDQSFKITWVVGAGEEDQVRGFDLFFTTDNGASFTPITEVNPTEPALDDEAREFDWTVPRICSSTVKVLVRATSITSAISSDSSNSNFSIAEPAPHIDPGSIHFASGKKLVFRVQSGSTPLFLAPVTVEVSNDEAGSVFFQAGKVTIKAGGEKIQTGGKIAGQKIRQFIPDGAVRFVRIRTSTCAVNLLRLRRVGENMVPEM